MSSEAPFISVSLSSKQDLAIIRWLELMKLERPRYASVYAREAIRHYINTQSYMVIGAVCIDSDQVPEKKVLNIIKDDMLKNLVNTVEKRSVSPLVRSILKKSIMVCAPGEEYIPDVIDILNNPIDFSSMTGVIKPVEAQEQPPDPSPEPTAGYPDISSQPPYNPPEEVSASTLQIPEQNSSGTDKNKSILQTLGARLE